jgi:PEP-CTERM motif
MKKTVVLLLSLLLSSIVCQSTNAAIVLTAGSATFLQNTGIQAVDLLVRSNAADTSLFLTADFQLSAGVFPTAAGSFNQAGMVGAGNIQAPPISQFVSAGNNSATLSLDFTNPQLFPAADAVLARMFIDTTGLGIGTYNILVTSIATQVASSSVNGTFTITAVPEPSSLILIGVATLLSFGRRKVSSV